MCCPTPQAAAELAATPITAALQRNEPVSLGRVATQGMESRHHLGGGGGGVDGGSGSGSGSGGGGGGGGGGNGGGNGGGGGGVGGNPAPLSQPQPQPQPQLRAAASDDAEWAPWKRGTAGHAALLKLVANGPMKRAAPVADAGDATAAVGTGSHGIQRIGDVADSAPEATAKRIKTCGTGAGPAI